MRDFIITTDNTADLPDSFLAVHNIKPAYLPYSFGDKIYNSDSSLSIQDFYNKMRGGEMPTTMALNPDDAKDFFNSYIQKGLDILYICFSSGLSSTYNNACIAAKEIMDENPDSRIIVIDSLAASLGEGLMVYRAYQLKEAGLSIDETASYLNEHAKNFVHLFTVDDLNHLHRGGRVSKATAIVGTLAGIKPILHVDDEGHLIAIGKTRGRKKSILELLDRMETLIGSYKDETDKVFISHGDCLEDAQFLADKIKERFGKEVIINYICPTIGTHSGPGTLALFFMGEHR